LRRRRAASDGDAARSAVDIVLQREAMHREDNDHLTVRTSQFDEVVATMRDVFGRIEIRRDDAQSLTLRMRSSSTAGLRMTRWTMSGRCSGGLDLLEQDGPAVLAGVALAGDVGLWTESSVLDTSRPYLCPERFDFRLTRADIMNLAIDRSLLEAHAGALMGTASFAVQFSGTAPLDDLKGRAWRDTVAYASRVLDLLATHPDSRLVRAAVVDAVCSMLLRTFPNTALSTAAHGSKRPGAAVQRAVDFIDEHLTDPIHPSDLAHAAHMSLRGLHAAFRRELATTPMAYVRAARLTAARRQLQELDPASADLSVIAQRWGFASARRFSSRYAQIHHETPADTLRH
jgi:AraC-like DNA-binding protein